MNKIDIKDVIVHVGISPYVDINKIGTIGMWCYYDKSLHFDYSMKWLIGTNQSIPCNKTDIEKIVVELFNKNK